MEAARPGLNMHKRIWLCCGMAAISLHAIVLFLWETQPRPMALSDAAEGTVEVELFEGSAQMEAAPPVEQAEAPEETPPPVPEVQPEWTPADLPISEQVEPRPTSAATPQPAAKPAPRKTAQAANPKATAGASGAGDTRKGTPAGTGGTLLSKPTYIVKPSASYPMESRAAKEEGIAVLRITVNANGRPTDVRILSTSGHPRLDRAAQEAGWRCRIRNASAGDQFNAPLRFSLQK